MWIKDIDIPAELLEAQRDGNLVIFAGAGVSQDPPSKLPDFDSLTNDIAGGTRGKKAGETHDAFLGRLAQEEVNVQLRARRIIDRPDSKPTRTHRAIVDLFKGPEHLRLITTDFDRHFTTVLHRKYRKKVEIFTGPALPVGRKFAGLVYLHGAVEKPDSNLVVTDADVGQAYLGDGWARRFLSGMFEKFVVLFIGYSHQDPVMHYLSRGFVKPTARFALTEPRRDEHWTGLGIRAVQFPLGDGRDQYSAIPRVLSTWSGIAHKGPFEVREEVARLVGNGPPTNRQDEDRLRFYLASPVGLRKFADCAQGPEWLSWPISLAGTQGEHGGIGEGTSEESLLNPLISIQPFPNSRRPLIAWFVNHILPEHPLEALEVVRPHLLSLNREVCEEIALGVTGWPPHGTPTLGQWAITLLAAPQTSYASLVMVLRKCAETREMKATRLLLAYLTKPTLRFAQHRHFTGVDQDIEIRLQANPKTATSFSELTNPDAADPRNDGKLFHPVHELREIWQIAIKPNTEEVYRELLEMVAAHLKEGYALLEASGQTWDAMGIRDIPVEGDDPVEDDDGTSFEDWWLLVIVGRDLLEWAILNDRQFAWETIENWGAAAPQLLNRLALHGVAKLEDLDFEQALLLIERNGWLYKAWRVNPQNQRLPPLTKDVLKRVFPSLDPQGQQRLIAHSMTAPVFPNEDSDEEAKQRADMVRWGIALEMQQSAPDSEVVAEHCAKLRRRLSNLVDADGPEIERSITAQSAEQATAKPGNDLLAMDIENVVDYLAKFTEVPSISWISTSRLCSRR